MIAGIKTTYLLGKSSFSIPFGLHDNHTSANLKATFVQQVDLQAPFSPRHSHIQKTVT